MTQTLFRATAMLAAVVALAAPSASAQECVPSCRSGYTCVKGQCVSRCNPACAAGETCLDAGECTPTPPPPPPGRNDMLPPPPPPPPNEPRYATPPANSTYAAPPSAVGSGLRVSTGWARAAGIIGLISTGVGALGTFMILVTNGTKAANYFAVGTTLFVGVMVPVVAAGAGSARGDEVFGSVGLRVSGWILYGLSMVSAVTATLIGIACCTVPSGIVAGIGGLAILSLAFMSIDALIGASQASTLNEQRGYTSAPKPTKPVVRYAPYATVVPSVSRGAAPGVMAGFAMTF